MRKAWKKVFAMFLMLVILVSGINWSVISVEAETTGEKEISSEILLKNVTTNSEEEASPAANVFRDEGTWHSNWHNGNVGPSSNNKIWIQTGFDELKVLSKVSVTPVAADGYGYRRINQYEISVARLDNTEDTVTDDDFTVVKTGRLDDKEGEQDIVFKQPVAATHIRIIIISMHLSYYNNYATASRIRIFENPNIVNTPEIQIVQPVAGETPSDAYMNGYTAGESAVVPSSSLNDDITISLKSGEVAEFSKDEGHYAVKGCYTVSSTSGILNVVGNRPFVIQFDMKLPTDTASGTYAVIGKMDEQYGVQAIVEGSNVKLQMYCHDSTGGWPTYREDIGAVLGEWVSVTAVYDGQKFWMKTDENSFVDRAPVQGNATFSLTGRSGSVFSFGGRHDRSDYNFPGLLSNMSMYVAAADSTEAKTADQIDDMVAVMRKDGTLAFDTDVLLYTPYTISTTWTDAEGNSVETFEHGKTYEAEIVLNTIDGRVFAEEAKPACVWLNGVETVLDENAVELSEDNTVMTMKYTYTVPELAAKLTNATASLKGKIDVNFYVEVNDASALDDLSVKLTRGDDVVTYEFTDEAFTDDGLYRFTYDVAAKEMTDAITAELMNGEEIISTASLSVKEYTNALKEYYEGKEDFEKLEALLDAMLNYGAAAQTEFVYNTADLANDGVEKDFTNTVITVADPVIDKGIDAAVVDVSNVSLLLKSDTTLRFYLKAAEGVDLSTYTVDPALAEGETYAEFTDIAAKDLDEVRTFTVTDGTNTTTVKYSPLNYAKAVVDSETTSSTLKTVAKALYEYNVCADAYFGE